MICIEPAAQTDIPRLFALEKELIARYEDLDTIDLPHVLGWCQRKLEKKLDTYRRIIWEGQIAGYYSCCPADGKLELDSLYILPEFQNRGIGTQIIRRLQQNAGRPVFLYVFLRNEGAVALYKRLGFVTVETIGTSRCIMEWKP